MVGRVESAVAGIVAAEAGWLLPPVHCLGDRCGNAFSRSCGTRCGDVPAVVVPAVRSWLRQQRDQSCGGNGGGRAGRAPRMQPGL